MADTYTSAAKAVKIEDGTRASAWASGLNGALEMLDDMASGSETINLGTSTSYSMAALANETDSESRARYLRFTGTPASAVTVTVPASVTNKKYRVQNNSGQLLTFKYSSGGTVVIQNGDTVLVWCDGTDIKNYFNALSSSTNATSEFFFTNANTGNAGQARVTLNNGSTNLSIGITSTGYSGAAVTNGPTGESAYFGTRANIPLSLITNGSERVRITGAGLVAFPSTSGSNFVVGATSSVSSGYIAQFIATGSLSATFHQNADATLPTSVLWNKATSGDNKFLEFYTETGGTLRGSITYNRGGGVVAYNTSSDARLKTNIADAASASSIIDSIKVRSFDWIGTNQHVSHWVVAQELYQSVPFAVTKGDDGAEVSEQWSVDSSKLVPLLVKEIQDLRLRVSMLENRTV